MATFHSNTQRRKDEPEDLRQLRQEHGGSLATLKELFADWTEEDLLYAIQDAGGDLELTILRISEGHATQWGEVKGKKKTPKAKTASEKQEFRSSNSQRGGFAGRGRGDSSRGGRGGATRGAPRALNGGDRNGRPAKAETEVAAVSEKSLDETSGAEKTESSETAAVDSTADTASAWGAAPAWGASTTNDSSTSAEATDAWSTPATATATATATTNDAWGAPVTATSAAAPVPVRKVNTATIPAGSKMSWAKIVKPEPAPQPVIVPAPAPAPAAPSAPVNIPAPEPTAPEVEKVAEPVVEAVPEVAATVVEEKAPEAPAPEVTEPVVEEKIEEPIAAPEPTAEPEPVQAAPASPKGVAPVGPPGLKPKAATQPRRLNQDAPVVMPGGSASLQSVGVKFGSFSLNDDAETPEPEPETAQPTQPAQEQSAQQPSAPAQPTTPSQQPQQQQPAYGRQTNVPAGASGFQGASPAAATGLSPASNASYLKQDPAANYLGQHHHHPGMGHDAMGSPYGSYMPNPATQLGSFGMPPMASLPNDYAALYGNDLQRAMYYDPATYGQIPVTAANNYQSRDSKYNQDSSATASTSGAASTGSTQAQQTLQQQQQQQQVYPNMAGGLPYYPYYYMPNQFPNAYQQSGYGQPFVNKNMYPMYQHQQQQQQSSKPGAANSSPYGNYSSTAGQGHHQYSQTGYEDMSGAGIHGMGTLNNDPYAKYGNPGMQNFLGNQQQPAASGSNASNTKGSTGSSTYSASDKNASAGSQSGNNSQMTGGASSLQGQQPGNGSQNQQGYYQQQMFSSYQYPSHHQGYHPNQHQGQHQGSGRNQQQFWSQN
ncbi:RNAPII degradation factor [Mortierella sp. GBA30]|nr:RNAPII degradation factor [Mortierella sp. GBA30]